MKTTFLNASGGEPTSHTPVWFMRQAGRSLPEYRELRLAGSIVESLCQPEIAAEITMQPIRRYGVDAAILYSDIMVPLIAIGAGVEMVSGKGPVVAEPYRDIHQLKRLRAFEPEEDTGFVLETIEILVKELDVPLIGFAGAPFTLASYLIEGGPSRNYAWGKAAMYLEDEPFFQALLDKLTDIVIASLKSQIEAGVSAIQLFDSWVGVLSAYDYEKYVLPHTQKIFQSLAHYNIPLIHFGVGTSHLLHLMGDSGATVLGIDWRVPLSEARKLVPNVAALQGNLDPTLCLAEWSQVEKGVLKVLEESQGDFGHIFNLGHGVLPETNPDILKAIVELVHSQTAK